jgi:NAD(P)-dependent dehydrogenase (short-subunit alcohol dehydrogenase family)
MVDTFARLSGDYNSLHMNPEVARRSRFRRPIVHGMLPLSFLALIQEQYRNEHISFTRLSAHFNKPVFVNDTIILKITCKSLGNKVYSLSGSWYPKGSNELLMVAKGNFELLPVDKTEEPTVGCTRSGFLTEPVMENRYTIEELDEQSETLDFELNDVLIGKYLHDVLSAATRHTPAQACCPNLIATLLLSTMVGMRLPGRYATFTRFDISFDNCVKLNRPSIMQAKLSRISREAEVIEVSVSVTDNDGVLARGKYEASLNSPPRPMLTCDEICKQYMDFGLSGKVALITGASRGIGETTAKLLAMQGVKTVVTYRSGKSDAESIVNEIQNTGGDAFACNCDITFDDQVHRLVADIIDHYGHIDILVNNAVREFSPKDLLDLTWDDYLGELEVSVKGMHACCKAVIPLFKRAGSGKIINLSTVAVANPVSGQSRYITAKSAVEGYTKSLAVELARYGIQANLVTPNMTDTDLVSVIPALYREKIAASNPYQRHVQPIEVAQAICYLASNWSDAMTGQKIVLNLASPPFA